MNSEHTKPLFVIHFGEIALKGNNRPDFEARLVENIRKSLVGEDFEKIFRTESRIILYTNEKSNHARIAEKLQKIFGIEWFAEAYETEADIEKIKKNAWELRNNVRETVKVDANRSDKRFPMNSMEINKLVGEVFHESGKYKIDVKNPETVIGIEILNKTALIYFNKIRGVGGLPVGCTGKVVCLLSGGIDSPVAAWMMMKRGCIVEFVHAYAQANVDEVKNSKMANLIAVLKQYNCGSKMKLHAIPYSAFYGASFSMPHKKELVLFRRFLLKVANRIAKQSSAQKGAGEALGIVTGDNLAQVASQTLENLHATDEASELPVYRPVIGFDKKEIIEMAKRIGTYDLSIQEYKDCCSLVAAKHPSTKMKLEDAKKIEKECGMEKIVEETMGKVEEILV